MSEGFKGFAQPGKDWSKCVTEFGKMVSHEVKTNPRYKDLQP